MAVSPVAAQQGRLRGVVVDSAGLPVAQADIGILAVHQLARSDDEGRFGFTKLPLGELVVSIRRLGYEPTTARVVIAPEGLDSLRVVLVDAAVALDFVQVSSYPYRLRASIEDFHRRRIRGIGTFVTRDQIVARNSMLPSDILREMPGLRLVRTRTGRGIRFASASSRRGDCLPMIWIDGQRAEGLEVDDIPLSDIEGIELYNGPATTPMQFSASSSTLSCGTIVIWSRPPNVRTP
jgi:hypothetical protein